MLEVGSEREFRSQFVKQLHTTLSFFFCIICEIDKMCLHVSLCARKLANTEAKWKFHRRNVDMHLKGNIKSGPDYPQTIRNLWTLGRHRCALEKSTRDRGTSQNINWSRTMSSFTRQPWTERAELFFCTFYESNQSIAASEREWITATTQTCCELRYQRL